MLPHNIAICYKKVPQSEHIAAPYSKLPYSAYIIVNTYCSTSANIHTILLYSAHILISNMEHIIVPDNEDVLLYSAHR